MATAANRTALAARTSLVLVQNYGGVGYGIAISHGPLTPDITGLAVGTASVVRVSATGTLERVAFPVAADDIVGFCDASGLLHTAIGLPTFAIVPPTYGGDLYGSDGAQLVRGLSGDAFGVIAFGAASIDATGAGPGLARTKELSTRTVMTGALASVLDVPVGTMTDLNVKIIVDVSFAKRVRIDLARIQGGSVGPGYYTPTAIPDSVYAPDMGTGAPTATYDLTTYFDGVQYRVRIRVNATASAIATLTASLVYQ